MGASLKDLRIRVPIHPNSAIHLQSLLKITFLRWKDGNITSIRIISDLFFFHPFKNLFLDPLQSLFLNIIILVINMFNKLK